MTEDKLIETLKKVASNLVESDEGELFLVENKDQTVHLHLRGRFSGCPGNSLVKDYVLSPLIRAVRPQAKLEITSGAILPDGAERIEPMNS